MSKQLLNHPIFLGLVSGLLASSAYIPLVGWTCVVCFTPLFLAWLQAPSAKKSFWSGWAAQFTFSAISFHWVSIVAVEFGHFPLWAGALLLVAFAAFIHIHYALIGWFVGWLAEKRPLPAGMRLAIAVLLIAICEELEFLIFPWTMGYSWYWNNWPGAQIADWIGFRGLGLISYASSALLALAIYRRSFKWAAAAVALVLVPQIIGWARLPALEAEYAEGTKSKVIVVQANIGNFEKLQVETGQSDVKRLILDKYLELTRRGLIENPDADWILWPETGFPEILELGNRSGNVVALLDYLRSVQKPLVTGAYSAEKNADGQTDVYNGIFYLPKSSPEQYLRYRKTHLLAFGEYFPIISNFKWAMKLFPGQGAFERGPGPTVWPTTPSIGPQVCYEGLFPYFSNGLAQKGAQVFVNVTNDSWFGMHFQPYQHLYMTGARAIEFRRPVVRSTNTGISTVIDPLGKMAALSPLGKAWVGAFEIKYKPSPASTFYQKLEPYWLMLLAAGLVFLLGYAWRMR